MTPQLISVIVPVYNAEKFIGKCLETLLQQTHDRFEIIAINDASQDASLSIMKGYAQKDNRLTIIDLAENSGVSHARNLGIAKATGSYITLVDADDYVDLRMLERMCSALDKTYDLVVSGVNTVYSEEGSRIEETIPPELSAIGFSEVGKVYNMLEPTNLLASPFNKFYRTEIIKNNNISFADLSLGEDQVFVLDFLRHTQSVRLCSFAGYYYLRHSAPTLSKGAQRSFVQVSNFLSAKFTKRNALLLAYELPPETKEVHYRKNLIIYVSMIVALYSPRFPVAAQTRMQELKKFREEGIARMYYAADFGKKFNLLKIPICFLPVPVADMLLKKIIGRYFEKK